MRLRLLVVLVALTLAAHAAAGGGQLQQTNPPCNVTAPNGVKAGAPERQRSWHGNAFLSVGNTYGTIVLKLDKAGFVSPESPLRLKFGWMRAAQGKLTVTGHRLDGDAPPLQADIKCWYKETGFQSSYLIFPTPGCWEVVAELADVPESKLTFVTRIVMDR